MSGSCHFDAPAYVAEARQIREFERLVENNQTAGLVGATKDLHEWRKDFIRRLSEEENRDPITAHFEDKNRNL